MNANGARRVIFLVLAHEAAGQITISVLEIDAGQSQLLHVVLTHGAVGRFARFLHGRQEEADQYGNDCNNYKQFDKGKCLALGGGDGDAYLAYMERTVKPLVDRRFRTRPERDATGVFGSSLGGLISLYAFFRAPETFGFVGAMSPSIWFGQGAVLDFIARTRAPRGRIYADVGMQEGAGTLKDARRLGRLLVRKGFRRRPRAASQLRYLEDPQGRHQEAAWARRLDGALEFLLA